MFGYCIEARIEAKSYIENDVHRKIHIREGLSDHPHQKP